METAKKEIKSAKPVRKPRIKKSEPKEVTVKKTSSQLRFDQDIPRLRTRRQPNALQSKSKSEHRLIPVDTAPKILQQDSKEESSHDSPEEKKHDRYWEAVGRRKTAVARVRLFTRGERGIWVNGKPSLHYFQYPGFVAFIEDPLRKMKSMERFRITAKISGGGLHAQAEAMRHGISRALVKFNADFRKRLKRAGYLKRDPRMKERKKFGLKGARRAPQWAKR